MIVQSFRRHDVPGWIARCLESVESWARDRGHGYRFVDDELFDRLPPAYRLRTQHSPQLMADLARLLVARELHAEGHERVAWVDADVLVFAPERFVLPTERDVYFSREVWLEQATAEVSISERVNNCVCVFERRGNFLPFYIEACQQLVRDAAGALSPLLVGTQFLTAIDRVIRLPLVRDVGLLGPDLVHELATGAGPLLATFVERTAAPIHAANLCASLRGRLLRRVGRPSFTLDDATFAAAVDTLLAHPEGIG